MGGRKGEVLLGEGKLVGYGTIEGGLGNLLGALHQRRGVGGEGKGGGKGLDDGQEECG